MVLKVSRSEILLRVRQATWRVVKVNWLENQLTKIGEYDDGWSVVV